MASDFTKSPPAAPITDAQVRLALGFLRETDLKCRISMLFRCAITRSFSLRGRSLAALKPLRLISLQTAPTWWVDKACTSHPVSELTVGDALSTFYLQQHLQPVFLHNAGSFNEMPLGRLAPLSHFCTVKRWY